MAGDPKKNLQRVVGNVTKLRQRNADPATIESYLQGEGYSVPRFERAVRSMMQTGRVLERNGGGAIAQGATLGFADELEAALGVFANRRPGESIKDAYVNQRDAIRQADRDYRERHPWRAAGLEIAAGTPLAVLSGGGTAEATVGGQMLNGLKVGAGIGAASGLGHAEGSPSEQVAQSLTGGVVGGAAGAVLPPIFSGLRGTARKVAEILHLRSARSATTAADEQIVQAMNRDATGPRDIRGAYRAAQADSPKPETIVDLAGRNTRGLVRGAQALPGRTKQEAAEVLAAREGGTSERVAADITRRTGNERTDIFKMADDMRAAKQADAKGVYETAFNSPGADAIDDPVVQELLTHPRINSIYEKAALNSHPLPIKPQGTPPDLRTLDMLKRGLDGEIESGFRGGSMDSGIATNMRGLRNRLVDMLDERFPAYRAARNVYRGHMEMQEAFELGAAAPTMDARELARATARMNEAELNIFRLRAQDAYRQKARTPGGLTELLRMRRAPEFMDRIRHIFPGKEEFDGFVRDIARESRMRTTANEITGGSVTSRIDAEKAGLEGAAPQIVMDVATGGVGGAALSGIRRLLANAKGMTPEIADTIAEKLLATDPATIERVLTGLQGASRQILRAALKRARFRGAAASSAGQLMGRTTGLLSNE